MPVAGAISVVKIRSALSWILGLTLSLLAVYTAGFGPFDDIYQRTMAVCFSALLLLLARPLAGNSENRMVLSVGLLIDLLLFAVMSAATYWFFYVHDALETGLYDLNITDIWVGLGGLLVLLELGRRTMGMPLVIIGGFSIIYCLYGDYLPWIFTHAGYEFEETLRTMWYSFDGVFGLPVSVVANMIAVFIVFGVVLEGTGAGALLLKIAFSLTGHLRGGPAHAAVVSSGLFGTISGSVVGNVVGTGVFTMPMISKRGFPKAFAGAVEAAASSGGQFMPPVMGAVAFIMAELTGAPYLTICLAALLPALFYYGSLFCAVSVEASRLGIQPIPKEEREKLSVQDWVRSLSFFIPIAVIIGTLLMGRSPAMAGFWSIVAALISGFALNPEFRQNPLRIINTFASAGRTVAIIMVAVGVIGIVIGMMNITGLGIRFSTLILALSGDSLFLSLLLMMLGSIVLGMGLPTVPAYLIIVLVMAPAIQELGVDTLLVHLFVMYFGVLSSITPPVAIAAYAAAPICGAPPLTVAAVSVRVALIGFIIPFVMIYNPSLVLVLDFDYPSFVWVLVSLSVAIWLFATGIGGADKGILPYWSRALRVLTGAMAVIPVLEISLAGIFAGGALVVYDRLKPSSQHLSKTSQ